VDGYLADGRLDADRVALERLAVVVLGLADSGLEPHRSRCRLRDLLELVVEKVGEKATLVGPTAVRVLGGVAETGEDADEPLALERGRVVLEPLLERGERHVE